MTQTSGLGVGAEHQGGQARQKTPSSEGHLTLGGGPGPREGWHWRMSGAGDTGLRPGEGQRTKWHSWQGSHEGLALTPSLAVPPAPRPAS